MLAWMRRPGAAASSFLALVALLVPMPAAASADTSAPVLAAFSVEPATIDTSGAARPVTISARITDDLAGLANGGAAGLSTVRLTGPGGVQVADEFFSQAQRESGSALDGTYRTVVMLPRHSEPGSWALSVRLVDGVGNARTYSAAQLAGAGFASTVQQAGAGDANAPNLLALSVTPTAINTADAPATVVVTARLTDDLAGVSAGAAVSASQIDLAGPSGAHEVSATLGSAQRTSGSAIDGVYSASIAVPRWSEQGTWSVRRVVLYDQVGNTRTISGAQLVGASFATTFEQTGPGDVSAPQLRAFSVSPPQVDATVSAATVTFRTRITDTLSGTARGITNSPSEAVYASPSGATRIVARFGAAQQVSGDANDGWYEFRASIPAGAEQGTWSFVSARPVDQARNAATLGPSEWATLGFPAGFGVVSDGRPGPPTNLTAAPGPASASVTWVPPTATGTSAIVDYTVRSSPGDQTVTVPASQTRATVPGLVPGASYTFTVTARNAAGSGSASSPSNAVRIEQASDSEAPQLTSLEISPPMVQTTDGPAVVQIDVGVRDDLTGPAASGTRSSIRFRAPSGATPAFASAEIDPDDRIAGDARDGSYRVYLTLPQGSELGVWSVDALTLIDGAARTVVLDSDDLAADAHPTSFQNVLATVPAPPTAVSASGGDRSATITWVSPVDDGGTPITSYRVTATPGGETVSVPAGSTSATLTGLTNGTAYSFVVVARNALGNGNPSEPSNTIVPSETGDVIPPALSSLALDPTTVVADGTAHAVAVTARVTDAGSGIAAAPPFSRVAFARPLGAPFADAELGPPTRISGDANDGIYTDDIAVAADTVPGRYPIVAVVLRDGAGNQVTIDAAQLAAAGFATGFDVVADDGARPPGVPTEVSATAGDTSARVTWLAPADTGTAALVDYLVSASPGGAVATVAAGTTEAIVAGLANGTAYTFTVVARSSAGSSAPSAPSNAVTPGTPDTVAPTLDALRLDRGAIDTGPTAETLTVTVEASDAGGLVDDDPFSRLLVRTPAGGDAGQYVISADQRIAGDASDGTYEVAVTIPARAAVGTWTLALVLRDAAGNATTLTSAQLAAAGQPASFVVRQRITEQVWKSDGYWAVGRAGKVRGFGSAASVDGAATIRTRRPVTGIAAAPAGRGYWVVDAAGKVRAFGSVRHFGGLRRTPRSPVIDIEPTPTGRGYWLVTLLGRVYAFGDARTRPASGRAIRNTLIVGMAATPSGRGYRLVGADGSVYPFGDARPLGSLRGRPLRTPVVAIVAPRGGGGYWLVQAGGRISAFGAVPSPKCRRIDSLQGRIVAAAPSASGRGLWMISGRGEIVGCGDAYRLGGFRRSQSPPITAFAVRTRV